VTPITIELAEYSISKEVLPFGVAAAVVEASSGALTVTDVTAAGVRLQSQQHVGVVATSELEVRIRPKIPEANVLGMLAAATRLTSWLDAGTTLDKQPDLLRTIVAFYARSLHDVLAQGLQRSYQDDAGDLIAPRGRLDIPAMVSMGGLPAPVPCRFDEYTSDHLLHRYLVTALERCLHLADLDGNVRQWLLRARRDLSEVASVELAPDAIERHHFSRLDDRYRPVAALARLVLEHLSIDLLSGTRQVRSFTVDMNRLFEAWVAARLPHHLPPHLEVAAQTTTYLDEDARLALHPDLEIRAGRQAVYVADTKYKLTTGLGRISDYYQAHAYATVLGLPETLLIYCQAGDAVMPVVSEIRRSGVSVRIHAMELRGTHGQLEDQLANVAEVITQGAVADERTAAN
jgi:5-methylcytosine-specific restriction enzyme subunit McrC